MRLFKNIKRINRVVYQLALPTSMRCIHDVLHTSLLHKYLGDPSQVIKLEDVQLKDNLTYKECLAWIVD